MSITSCRGAARILAVGRTVSHENEASSPLLSSLTIAWPIPRIAAISRREKLKLTLGTLTLVHYGINCSLKNVPFFEKREGLFVEFESAISIDR
jgi:hypothetical protein